MHPLKALAIRGAGEYNSLNLIYFHHSKKGESIGLPVLYAGGEVGGWRVDAPCTLAAGRRLAWELLRTRP